MQKDYSYDYEFDMKYCYPESQVLINKLGITDAVALAVAEREITSLRIAGAKDTSIKGIFDLKHLQKINKYVFGDIYPWAGKLRMVNISKGNQFCLFEHLESYAVDLFSKLRKEHYLIQTPVQDVPKRLAFYLSEINVLHPFREGNGRTQRLFIEYLANVAGYEVDFSEVSDIEMIVASAESFAQEYNNLNALFEVNTSPIAKDEQRKAIVHFFGKNSELLKLLQ